MSTGGYSMIARSAEEVASACMDKGAIRARCVEDVGLVLIVNTAAGAINARSAEEVNFVRMEDYTIIASHVLGATPVHKGRVQFIY